MQEKYNKPDTEKDLSDAEVSMSCLLHQTIIFMEQFTELSDKIFFAPQKKKIEILIKLII